MLNRLTIYFRLKGTNHSSRFKRIWNGISRYLAKYAYTEVDDFEEAEYVPLSVGVSSGNLPYAHLDNPRAEIFRGFTYKQILREYNDNRPQISNLNKEWDKIWKLQ